MYAWPIHPTCTCTHTPQLCLGVGRVRFCSIHPKAPAGMSPRVVTWERAESNTSEGKPRFWVGQAWGRGDMAHPTPLCGLAAEAAPWRVSLCFPLLCLSTWSSKVSWKVGRQGAGPGFPSHLVSFRLPLGKVLSGPRSPFPSKTWRTKAPSLCLPPHRAIPSLSSRCV